MNWLKRFNAIQTFDSSNLVIKTNYNIKINEIQKEITDHNHNRYITTQEFNYGRNFLLEDQHKQIQQAKLILLIL